jgi:hypothetical protein
MATRIDPIDPFGKFNYYKDRTNCPKCESHDIELEEIPVESGVDKSKATCKSCKWSGIIDELVQQK